MKTRHAASSRSDKDVFDRYYWISFPCTVNAKIPYIGASRYLGILVSWYLGTSVDNDRYSRFRSTSTG